VSLARRAWQRLWQAIRPSAAAPGLEREIDSHLALLADEFARRGLSPEEARLAARRRFGSVAHAKDLHRDSRSFVWLEDIRRDVIVAVRMLRRTPGFASVAVLTLAMVIGAFTNPLPELELIRSPCSIPSRPRGLSLLALAVCR
jgi:hypothetical protein